MVPRVSHLSCWRRSGVIGAGVAAQEEDRGEYEVYGYVGRRDLVELEAEGECRLPQEHCGDAHADDSESGSINEGQEPAAVPVGETLLREGEREVQEQGRLECLGDDVAPVDDPVQIVELAGVVEGVQRERYEAEDVEVHRARSGPAAEEDVETDGQVDEADDTGGSPAGCGRRERE